MPLGSGSGPSLPARRRRQPGHARSRRQGGRPARRAPHGDGNGPNPVRRTVRPQGTDAARPARSAGTYGGPRPRRGEGGPDLPALADARPRDAPLRGDPADRGEDRRGEVHDPLPGGVRADRPRDRGSGRARALLLEPRPVRVQAGSAAHLSARSRRDVPAGGSRMIELRTPRLRLRPFTATDAPVHLALYQDAEVTRQLGGGPFVGDQIAVRSQRAIEKFVRHWAEKGFGVFAVEEHATGRFLGQCGLNTIAELGEIEVLYALERAAWGRGFATEAARAALAYGFGEAGLPRIIAVTRPEHARSRHVLEKLGMSYERDVNVFGIQAVLYALTRGAFGAAG